jgi:hypothetical protein
MTTFYKGTANGRANPDFINKKQTKQIYKRAGYAYPQCTGVAINKHADSGLPANGGFCAAA